MTGYDLGEALKIALEPVTKNLVEISKELEAAGPLLREALMAFTAPTDGGKPVTRCMNCVHGFDLEPVDPMRPYSGTGDGSFFCVDFDMDFYAPEYRAETFFCKNGRPRGKP